MTDSLYRFWIDNQAPGNVGDDEQTSISGQEGFGDAESLVGGIIERTLKPLLGSGLQRRSRRG